MHEQAFMLTIALLLATGELVSPPSMLKPEGAASGASASGRARIVLERDDGLVRIHGVFDAPQAIEPRSLDYTLQFEREGENGSIQSSQRGSFEVVPGSVDTLATARINTRPDDHLSIDLIVRDGSGKVAEAHRTWSCREGAGIRDRSDAGFHGDPDHSRSENEA